MVTGVHFDSSKTIFQENCIYCCCLWKTNLTREQPFITGGGIFSATQKKLQPPFACARKDQPPWARKQKFNPTRLKFIFYTYPHSIVFHDNSLFITFIKNVCWGGIKTYSPPFRIWKKIQPPFSPVVEYGMKLWTSNLLYIHTTVGEWVWHLCFKLA